MCLEVSYRNIRITERWKRNKSDVCAWKYHTEILELQRDAWKRNRSVVCAWKYHTEILELQRDAWKRNRKCCMCLEVSYRNIRITERCVEEK